AKQVHFETLDKLCIALDCRLDEILDHVSEEKTEPKE
ncbi:helix-turn-helix domain-containing protein, partial [Paenibacillus alvei]